MTKLCPRGKAAAKRKFKVYPSAYANAYASKICAGKIKDPSGVKRKDFRGPKPTGAKKGKAIMIVIGVGKKKKVQKKMGGGMTAGSMSGMGRLQKARMMNKGGGADLKKDPTKPVNPFLKRRMKLAGAEALKAAKATRIGKIAAGVAGAALLGKAALEKMYEKRTGKKPFTKRPKGNSKGGLKAELNNPAKGYMAGGMADYYKDLM